MGPLCSDTEGLQAGESPVECVTQRPCRFKGGASWTIQRHLWCDSVTTRGLWIVIRGDCLPLKHILKPVLLEVDFRNATRLVSEAQSAPLGPRTVFILGVSRDEKQMESVKDKREGSMKYD